MMPLTTSFCSCDRMTEYIVSICSLTSRFVTFSKSDEARTARVVS